MLIGVALLPAQFEPWIVMTLPSGGFFTLAGWLLLIRYVRQRRAAPGSGLAESSR